MAQLWAFDIWPNLLLYYIMVLNDRCPELHGEVWYGWDTVRLSETRCPELHGELCYGWDTVRLSQTRYPELHGELWCGGDAVRLSKQLGVPNCTGTYSAVEIPCACCWRTLYSKKLLTDPQPGVVFSSFNPRLLFKCRGLFNKPPKLR